ncbi:OmpL47-type beta-barrel domain-containing protein [Paenibacillus agricola]|uniref:Fibronectin type-III domain-containing protein n=1 Tax=Paenibacillus agricola TaxID=2716264 RepID=A0ABX0JGG5_9BACL|nr:FlgD immunoglobulin-like domain containing protein [Paenibacillus agricola]NHN34881.1 hypothetical protein [Paenibacillus agricola]
MFQKRELIAGNNFRVKPYWFVVIIFILIMFGLSSFFGDKAFAATAISNSISYESTSTCSAGACSSQPGSVNTLEVYGNGITGVNYRVSFNEPYTPLGSVISTKLVYIYSDEGGTWHWESFPYSQYVDFIGNGNQWYDPITVRGSLSATPPYLEFTYTVPDTTPPTAPTISPATTTWTNAGSVSVGITNGIDSESGVNRTEYTLGGAISLGYTTYSGAFNIINEGQTSITARTIDNIGNISSTSSQTVRIDRTNPGTPSVTPATTAWTNAGSVIVSVTGGTDAASGVNRTEISMSGATTLGWTTYSGAFNVTNEGQTTISARTVDNAGNVGATSLSMVSIDRTTPTSPIVTPGNTAWTNAGSVSVGISGGTDAASGVNRTEYSLSGATTLGWTTYSGAFNVANEGSTTITARTIDNVGNTSSNATNTVRIDRTAPSMPSATPSITAWTNTASVSVNVTGGTDGASGVNRTEYSLSGATTLGWTTYGGAFNITNAGITTITVRSIDTVGNTSSSGTATVSIDRIEPTVPTVTPAVTAWTNASAVSVSASGGTDTASGVNRIEYSLSGATTLGWTAYSGAFNIITEGQTSISVRTVDNAANESPPVLSTVKIDRTFPTISGPVVQADSNTQLTVQPAAGDSGSGLHTSPYLFNRNNGNIGTWLNGTLVDSSLLPNTYYTYKYKARDAANNQSNYSVTASTYTLAANPTALNVTNATPTSMTFAITNDASNGILPEFRIIIKRVGDGATIDTTAFSNQLTNIIVLGLNITDHYDVYVTTRNANQAENAPVKMLSSIKAKQPPVLIAFTTADNQILSEGAGHNKLTLAGSFQDTQVGETMTLKYTIDGVITAKAGMTLTANGAIQPFTYDVLIDSTIPEGSQSMHVWIEDQNGQSTMIHDLQFSVSKAAVGSALVLNNGVEFLEGPNDPNMIIPYKLSWTNTGLSQTKFVRVSIANNFDIEGTYTEHMVLGQTSLSGTMQMPIDHAVGRDKTIFYQTEDQLKNVSSVQTAIIKRNIKPVLEFSIADRLAASKPTFQFEATDADQDAIGIIDIEVTGETNHSFTTAFSANYAYTGALSDGFYTVKASVHDAYGLASNPVIQTFFMNGSTDSGQFITIPQPGTGPGMNPPSDQWLGVSGLKFFYTVGKTMDNTVEVYNEAGALVRSLPQGIQSSGTYSVVWDAKDNNGNIVPSGQYKIVLKSFDGVNTFITIIGTVLLDTSTPTITFPISETGIGSEGFPIHVIVADDHSGNGELTGSIVVKDENGNIVLTKNIPTDLINGAINEVYKPISDGTYIVEVNVIDKSGNTVKEVKSYEWDTTAPMIMVIYADSTELSSADIQIRVMDQSELSWMKIGSDPTTMKVITDYSYNRENKVYGSIQSIQLNDGANTFFVEGMDKFGNKRMEQYPIFKFNFGSGSGSGSGGDSTVVVTPVGVPEKGVPEQIPVKRDPYVDLANIIGVSLDTKLIDMRNDTGGNATSQLVLDKENYSLPSTITLRDIDLSTIDLNAALDKAGLTKLLDDTEARISVQAMLFNDAIGLRLVVIGKDGSVNLLTIDIPFLASYTVPVGEDPHKWGVFKLDETTKRWSMIPSFVNPDGKLEARIKTGVYKAMRKEGLPIDLSQSWAVEDFIDMYNMDGLDLMATGEIYDYRGKVSINEIMQMLSKVSTEQQYSEIVDTVDRLNLYKFNLSRQEIDYLLNKTISTELVLSMKNFAGDSTIEEMKNFDLNSDPTKLHAFKDFSQVNEMYSKDLAIATNYNLLLGRENFTLAPSELTTREEAVTLMNRYARFAFSLKYNAMK